MVSLNAMSRGTSRIRTFLLAIIVMAPTWTVAHAQLPPEVEADRLLLVARDAMEAKQWGKARQALDAITKLGISVPAEFHYHRARALANDNSPREARDALTTFLQNADRNSATYRDALALFNKVDDEVNRAEAARKAAAEAAAAKERAEREAYAAMSESERTALRQKQSTLRAAEAGDAAAQYEVGTWYFHGRNGERVDYSRAHQWFKRAADKNNAEALSMLAVMYVTGRGVQKNSQIASDYRLKAARNGHAVSQGIQGRMLILDTLTMRDGPQKTRILQEANKWLKMAAQQGDAHSQFFLANGLYDGNPKSKNSQEARRLWRLAASQGHKQSASALTKHFGE